MAGLVILVITLSGVALPLVELYVCYVVFALMQDTAPACAAGTAGVLTLLAREAVKKTMTNFESQHRQHCAMYAMPNHSA